MSAFADVLTLGSDHYLDRGIINLRFKITEKPRSMANKTNQMDFQIK